MASAANSWREVSEWISERRWAQEGDEPRAPLVYRGCRAGRRFESPLLRRGEPYAAHEHHILGAFKRYAYRQGGPQWSDWEWLALAQHHGLPTRLLDFTFSPLIALHFASLRHPDESSVLWAVDYSKVHEQLPEKLRDILRQSQARLFGTEQLAACARSLDEFGQLAEAGDFALFWEPPSIDERIVNQSATFCVMSRPTARFDEWLAQFPGTGRSLELTPKARREVRQELDLIGITERLLFPDLTGLASWVARYYA